MSDNQETIEFEYETKPNNIIKVIGVGGGGGNAVNHMFAKGIKNVDFIVANTDNQALEKSEVKTKIQLGRTLTQGLGAGNNPENGENAAKESIEDIERVLENSDKTKMLFVTAGMGGGTGTGAAPVIAKVAKDMGILTIAIVTIPFRFEGPKRVGQAIEGLKKLKTSVDSLLVIDNQKILLEHGDEDVDDAFSYADDVLTKAARGIAEIITRPGHVNVDFADIKSVLSNSGISLMGTSECEGENRAIEAIEKALNSPLLCNNNILGAHNILINVFSSNDKKFTLNELNSINRYVQDKAGKRADLIWGKSYDDSLGDKINITLIAAGFDSQEIKNPFDNDGSYDSEETEILNVATFKAGDEVDLTAKEEENKEETTSDPVESTEAEVAEVEIQAVEEDENVSKVVPFSPIDYSSIDIREFSKTPAYSRKGITLGFGNYNASKCQKLQFVEV